jgi:cytochrome P450
VDNAVEELLRSDEPITSAMPRIAAEDVDLDGHLNKAGVVVGVPNIAYRDSVVFIDRNRFDRTRPNANQHISFTHGPHFCIGAHLARTELQMALATLMTRLPNLAVAVSNSKVAMGRSDSAGHLVTERSSLTWSCPVLLATHELQP